MLKESTFFSALHLFKEPVSPALKVHIVNKYRHDRLDWHTNSMPVTKEQDQIESKVFTRNRNWWCWKELVFLLRLFYLFWVFRFLGGKWKKETLFNETKLNTVCTDFLPINLINLTGLLVSPFQNEEHVPINNIIFLTSMFVHYLLGKFCWFMIINKTN